MRREPKKGILCEEELRKATGLWIKYIQGKYFPDVIKELKERRYSYLKNVGVYEDEDGALKCRGRFQFAEKRLLILMPKKCHFTKLIIINSHRRRLHAGVGSNNS